MHHCCLDSQRPDSSLRLAARVREAGASIAEIVVATALVLTVAVGITQMLLVSTRVAAANRVLTAARAIVQRNLDNAMAVRWDSANEPSILAVTTVTGAVFDDDGSNVNGEGTNKVALLIEKKTDGSVYTVIPATLTRTVTSVPNTQGANIRQIKFRLTYTFQNRNMVVEMSAMRSIDD